jgi:hypothetical protein
MLIEVSSLQRPRTSIETQTLSTSQAAAAQSSPSHGRSHR